jgi:small subunit ribosomal protein S18
MPPKDRSKDNSSRRVNRTPFLPAHVDFIDYKDTTLLARFISDRGQIRSRSVTGLTVSQQRMVARTIKNAREMASLPYHSKRTSS